MFNVLSATNVERLFTGCLRYETVVLLFFQSPYFAVQNTSGAPENIFLISTFCRFSSV